MKKFICGLCTFALAAAFCFAAGIAEEAQKGNDKANMSYAFGMVVASDLSETGLEFNYDSFLRGFRETMEKQKTQYTQNQAMDIIQTAYAAAQAEKAEANRAAGAAFLAENGKRPGVVTTSSGLQYESIAEGTGDKPGPDDTVLVQYRGATIDNKVFDSTYDNGGKPVEIPLARVIPGWSEGLLMMQTGGKAKFYIPPELAYGERGSGGVIGPNTVLVFDVELVSIVPRDKDAAAPGTGGTGDTAGNQPNTGN